MDHPFLLVGIVIAFVLFGVVLAMWTGSRRGVRMGIRPNRSIFRKSGNRFSVRKCDQKELRWRATTDNS